MQNLIELNLCRNQIKPEFSYGLLNINTPTWSLQDPNINLEFCVFSKGHTPKNVYAVKYRRVMDVQYMDHVPIYTDGSMQDVLSYLGTMSEVGVGAEAVCGQTVRMSSLPVETSIFSEVHEINIALDILSEKTVWFCNFQ